MTDVQPDESLALYKRLVDLLYSAPPADRQRAHWVMSTEWRDRLGDYARTVLHQPDPGFWTTLLGVPFEIDDAHGFPALAIPDP